MTAALDEPFIVDFDVQIRIWNAAWWGDVVEPAAGIAEDVSGNFEGSTGRHMWDRTAADLDTQLVALRDGPYRRPPEWWALPYATRHMLREHGDIEREAVA